MHFQPKLKVINVEGVIMDFVGAIKAGFQNYADFRGTATRPEYWYWVLFTFLVSIVTNAVDGSGTLSLVFSIATVVPGLSVTVRRLRDAGFSWTWVLLPVAGLVPFVYGLVVLIRELMAMGIEQRILDNPDLVDEAYINTLLQNPVIMDSIWIILFSGLYILFTSILTNFIFTAQRSRSYEDGNKRVAPKGPEAPIL